jgi:hypothetical protein
LGYETRPIVEPEEYNIQYDPNQIVFEHEKQYVSPNYVAPNTNSMGIGTSERGSPSRNNSVDRNSPRQAPGSPSRSFNESGDSISYGDPKSTIYPSNPSVVNPSDPDTRFSRNTLINDIAEPAVQPNASDLYNRATIQSQDFRSSSDNSKFQSGMD